MYFSNYDYERSNFYNSEPYLRLKVAFYESREEARSDPENEEKQSHCEYLFQVLNNDPFKTWSNYGTFDRVEIDRINNQIKYNREQQEILDKEDPIVEVVIPLDATHYRWGGMNNPGGNVLTWFKCEEFMEMPSIAFSLYTGITYKIERWYYKTENNKTWRRLEYNPDADALPPRKEKLSGRKSAIYGTK